MKITQVTAAIIQQEEKILICQRAEGGSCSYLWEFPGGKLEAGETLEECLIRECLEELGIEIRIKGLFSKKSHTYGKKEMNFFFYDAEIVSGEPEKKVHHDIKWVEPDELENFTFCPADLEVVESLKNGDILKQ